MRIRMRRNVFNPRAGGHLEERGVYEVPDHEGRILIASRQAMEVKDVARDPEVLDAPQPAALTR
jgi:hypothetical protein